MSGLAILALAGSLAAQTPDEALERARALVERDRGLEALLVLEEASRRFPEASPLHYELGTLYGATGRMREAVSSLERARELDPENTSYSLALGEAFLRSGRADEALPLLELAAAAENPPAEAWLLLAGALEQRNETERFLDALGRYLELEPGAVPVRLLLGEKLAQARRTEEALDVYRAGLRDGTEPDGTLLLRVAEELSRDPEAYEEAETFARRAISAEPSSVNARLVLARLMERSGKPDEAVAELEAARAESPDGASTAELHYNLATLYRRVGRDEDARAAAERFQELSTAKRQAEEREARVAAVYKRGADLLSSGDMLEAERAFRSVLEIDAGNAAARSMLAKIAFSKGDRQSARRWIDEALERDDGVGEYHYLSALFHARGEDPRRAEPAARKAVSLDPGFPDAWALLGSIQLDTGRPEAAIESFSKAAALEPSSSTHQLNLASAYAAVGDEAAERAAMERYRRLSRSP